MKTRMAYEIMLLKSTNPDDYDTINRRVLHNLIVEGETPGEIHETVEAYLAQLAIKARERKSVLSSPDDDSGYIKNGCYYEFDTGDCIYITKKQVRAI